MKKAVISFISTEQGDDLIVSFAVGEYADTSITFIRTPKFEALLPEEDRGVWVSDGDVETHEREVLLAIEWGSETVEFESTNQRYCLDISSVDETEAIEARHILQKMNFDHRFTIHTDGPLAGR